MVFVEVCVPGDPSLLEPSDAVVRVTVDGIAFEVPSDNTVLRLLQYLDYDLYPCRLCWNGDCNNCTFDFVDPATCETRTAKGCETVAVDGMVITRIPEFAVRPVKV